MIKIDEVTEHTKHLSILFVEDHDELRLTTNEILQSIFQTVTSCKNGQEALDSYTKNYKEHGKYYDIVLSDIEMPLMSGIDLTKNIYQLNPSQVVIIISAFDDSKYLLKLINLGIEQFIKKPIDSEKLLKSFLEASRKLTKEDISTSDIREIMFTEDVGYNLDTKSLCGINTNTYLTKFEIIFIELLISSFGKIYSNEDIVLHYTSCNESIDPSNIRKLVSKLRKKLPENALESIYGIGYKFTL